MQYDDHVWAWRSWRAHMFGFHAWLLSQQEPLGPEFTDILCDNLWDMYVRD